VHARYGPPRTPCQVPLGVLRGRRGRAGAAGPGPETRSPRRSVGAVRRRMVATMTEPCSRHFSEAKFINALVESAGGRRRKVRSARAQRSHGTGNDRERRRRRGGCEVTSSVWSARTELLLALLPPRPLAPCPRSPRPAFIRALFGFRGGTNREASGSTARTAEEGGP